MAQTAYRDGAAHDREEIEAEQARLTEADQLASGGSSELSAELETLRLRVRAPIRSSVDVTERRQELRRYDAALEASKAARVQQRRRLRVRLVVAGLCSLVFVSGMASIAFGGSSLLGGETSCVTSHQCQQHGRCSATLSTLMGATSPSDRSGCTARTVRHCEQSCWTQGRCELGDGKCVVGDAAQCKRSQVCFWEGRCTKSGDRCVNR